jgi:hypothetical protein
MCLVAQPTADSPQSTIKRRPSQVVLNCPDGGDDGLGLSPDTYIDDISWKRWNRRRAAGSGTIHLPQTGDNEFDVTGVQTFDVTFTLERPRKYTHGKGKKKRTIRTFTRVKVAFPDGGPHGQTHMRFNPPRKAVE